MEFDIVSQQRFVQSPPSSSKFAFYLEISCKKRKPTLDLPASYHFTERDTSESHIENFAFSEDQSHDATWDQIILSHNVKDLSISISRWHTQTPLLRDRNPKNEGFATIKKDVKSDTVFVQRNNKNGAKNIDSSSSDIRKRSTNLSSASGENIKRCLQAVRAQCILKRDEETEINETGAGETEQNQRKEQYHDYCIIGAGPSGLQMAYFLKKAARNYVIYERANISGAFFATFPRHRKLISINKRYTGSSNPEFALRHDWNSLLSDRESLLFPRFSTDFFPHADAMVDYLNAYQRELDINVKYDTDIRNVRRIPKSIDHPPSYRMNDQRGRAYSCKYLIMSTGMWKPYKPYFEGSHHADGYEDFDLDTRKYENKNVLILGRGNSAFETAETLYGHTNFVHMVSRSRARLAWSTHYVGDLRAVNNNLLDTYQLKSLDGLLEAAVEEMTLQKIGHKLFVHFPGDMTKNAQDHKVLVSTSRASISQCKDPPTGGRVQGPVNLQSLPRAQNFPMDNFSLREGYDYVIRCLGFTFDHSLFNDSEFFGKFGREGKYPGIKDTYESRILPGLYFAGTIAHSLDHRKSSGGFIHGFRYTVRILHRLLEWKNHGEPWPMASHRTLDLLNVIVRRVNEASGPYQMFQTLADVIILKKDGATFDFLEEFPVALLPRLETLTGRFVSEGSNILVILMEYGPDFSGPGKDTLRPDRATGDPMEAHRSNFLHPVLYYYESLPKESDMLIKWGKLPLPKPKRIHHVLEDFLTSWMAQQSHILPLRRFLETVSSQDLRHRLAPSCFRLSIAYSSLPVWCRPRNIYGGHLIFKPSVQT